MRLVHHVLRSYLGNIVVVYFDDILIFSMTMHGHEYHLRALFGTLRDTTLYVNK